MSVAQRLRLVVASRRMARRVLQVAVELEQVSSRQGRVVVHLHSSIQSIRPGGLNIGDGEDILVRGRVVSATIFVTSTFADVSGMPARSRVCD